MALPDAWTLHLEFPEERLTVDVMDDGVWIRYGQRDPVVVSWDDLDAIRPFVEVAKAKRRAK